MSVQIRVFIFFKYIPSTGIVESLFADDMILFLENLKSPTKKKNSRISEFSKVVRYKIDIQKSVASLYANKKLSEKSRKESHEKKYVAINLTEEMKDLYSEDYKTLIKGSCNMI